jgi:hypothetical protein
MNISKILKIAAVGSKKIRVICVIRVPKKNPRSNLRSYPRSKQQKSGFHPRSESKTRNDFYYRL